MRQVHVPLADETDRDIAVRGCVPARARGPDRHRTTTTSGGSVTPTVIQWLHEAIRRERQRGAFPGLSVRVQVEGDTDSAIAAVEQELAAKDAERLLWLRKYDEVRAELSR